MSQKEEIQLKDCPQKLQDAVNGYLNQSHTKATVILAIQKRVKSAAGVIEEVYTVFVENCKRTRTYIFRDPHAARFYFFKDVSSCLFRINSL